MMNLSKTEELSPARQSTGETSQELKPTRYKVLGSNEGSMSRVSGAKGKAAGDEVREVPQAGT